MDMVLGGALQKRGGRLQLFCRALWRPEQGKTHPVTALFDFLAGEGRLPGTVLCHADPLEITRLAPLFSRFHGQDAPRVCFAFDGTAGTLPEAALTVALTRLPGLALQAGIRHDVDHAALRRLHQGADGLLPSGQVNTHKHKTPAA